jgi:hypothetical protein
MEFCYGFGELPIMIRRLFSQILFVSRSRQCAQSFEGKISGQENGRIFGIDYVAFRVHGLGGRFSTRWRSSSVSASPARSASSLILRRFAPREPPLLLARCRRSSDPIIIHLLRSVVSEERHAAAGSQFIHIFLPCWRSDEQMLARGYFP